MGGGDRGLALPQPAEEAVRCQLGTCELLRLPSHGHILPDPMAQEGRKQSWFAQFPLVLLYPCAGSNEQNEKLPQDSFTQQDGWGGGTHRLFFQPGAPLQLCVTCGPAVAHACPAMAELAKRTQEGLACTEDLLGTIGDAGRFHI